MNVLMPRFIKKAYRKEPISSFLLIAGAVDLVMGGIGERWTLLSFGVAMVLLAATIRWWQVQQSQPLPTKDTPRRYLPPAPSAQPPLPVLTHKQRNS